jgi:hypothetical protein
MAQALVAGWVGAALLAAAVVHGAAATVLHGLLFGMSGEFWACSAPLCS